MPQEMSRVFFRFFKKIFSNFEKLRFYWAFKQKISDLATAFLIYLIMENGYARQNEYSRENEYRMNIYAF
jgi:hypothetical protein